MRAAWIDLLLAAMAPWRGQAVVVAVSGGGDSVGLLRGLVTLQAAADLRLSVATFDHSTRAGESAQDAAFVAGLANQLNLPCDVGHWQADRPGHFEADARRARYSWLLGVACQRAAPAVAVGHTSDDQAETILHRIVRGTGLTGLAGMAACRPLGPGVALIRPLLGVTRHEIRSYLTTIPQDWCDDPSNRDQNRTRARLRHDLLPRLAHDYNPNVVAALIRLGAGAAEAHRQAHRQARRRLKRLTRHRDATTIVLDRPGLSRLDPAGRTDVIRLAWRQLGWPEGEMTRARWTRLATRADDPGPGQVHAFAAGVEVVVTLDRFTLARRLAAPIPSPSEPQRLPTPGSVPWSGGRVVTTEDTLAPMDEWIDQDAVIGPLILRAPQPGDRFDPLGMAGQMQPLADFFRGRRVARADRPQVPLVTDTRGIVWVAGHRIAYRVRRTAATVRTLGLRYEPADG